MKKEPIVSHAVVQYDSKRNNKFKGAYKHTGYCSYRLQNQINIVSCLELKPDNKFVLCYIMPEGKHDYEQDIAKLEGLGNEIYLKQRCFL